MRGKAASNAQGSSSKLVRLCLAWASSATLPMKSDSSFPASMSLSQSPEGRGPATPTSSFGGGRGGGSGAADVEHASSARRCQCKPATSTPAPCRRQNRQRSALRARRLVRAVLREAAQPTAILSSRYDLPEQLHTSTTGAACLLRPDDTYKHTLQS